MVKHTLETLQHLLRDFESILDNFGTLYIKNINFEHVFGN